MREESTPKLGGCWRQLPNPSPPIPTPSFGSASSALNAQDLSTAATSLNRASQLRPANAQVWLALAQTQRKDEKQKSSCGGSSESRKSGGK